MLWLIAGDVRPRVEQALASRATASSDQAQAFARAHVEASDTPRNLKIAGRTAEIRISGILVNTPSILLWLYGFEQTTYRSITSALAMADANPDVRDIVLSIDSPGGAADGLFDTIAALETVQTPVSVRARLAASAAYGLAAAAGPIEAAHAAATFGSVGVVASYLLEEDVVDITSTEAPDKRPDVSTPEGQAVVRRYLDAVHELFADAIARGRNTTVQNVNKNYGRGAVLVAAEAARRGMIDSYPQPGTTARAGANGAEAHQNPRENTMNLEELRAKHPDLVSSLLEQGREEGVSAERRRCLDHLQLGAAAGIPEQARQAIEEGTSVSDMQATYLSAHMNRQDVAAAQADGDAAGEVAGAAPAGGAPDLEEQVHDMTIELLKGGAAHG